MSSAAQCDRDHVTPWRPPAPHAKRLLILTLAFFLAPACTGESAIQSRPHERAVNPPTHIPAPTPASILEPPLYLQEALAEPDNLLSSDPTPMRPPAAHAGGILRRSLPGPLPYRYNTITENITTVHDINAYVVEQVARRHAKDPTQWAPMLATRVARSEDGRVYTVHLRHNARWQRPIDHPSVPPWARRTTTPPILTAHDFALAFAIIKDPQVSTAAPARSWYDACESLRVIDDYTFEMRWRRAGLDAEMWTLSLSPVPQFLYNVDEDGSPLANPHTAYPTHWYRWPIGTGAYRVVSESPGEFLRLERHPYYAGIAPPIDAVDLLALNDDDAVDALIEGRLDVARLTPQGLARVLRRYAHTDIMGPYAHALREPALLYSYLGWNNESGPTADPRVRRALTMALDRQSIIRDIYGGVGRVPSSPYGTATGLGDPKIAPLAFDLEAAAALLTASGWIDRDGDGVREAFVRGRSVPLVIRMLTLGGLEGDTVSSEWAAILEHYQQDLARVGVTLRLIPLPGAVFDSVLQRKDFEGYTGGWGHDWEDDLYQVFHSSQADIAGGSNVGAYRSRDADALIEAIRSEPDAHARRPLHAALHAVIHRDQPYTFVREDEIVLLVAPRVRGVRFQHAWPQDLSLPWWIDSAYE